MTLRAKMLIPAYDRKSVVKLLLRIKAFMYTKHTSPGLLHHTSQARLCLPAMLTWLVNSLSSGIYSDEGATLSATYPFVTLAHLSGCTCTSSSRYFLTLSCEFDSFCFLLIFYYY